MSNVNEIQQFTLFQLKNIKKFKHKNVNKRFILKYENEKIKNEKSIFIFKIIN